MRSALALAGPLIVASAAHAALFSPPLTNNSFENGASAQIDDWFEEQDAGGGSGNDNFAEVRQDETAGGGTVPLTADGGFWLNLATRSGFTPASVYQQIGTFNTGDLTTLELSATLGDRSNQDFGTVFFEVWSSDDAIGAGDGTAIGTLAGATLLDSASFDITETASPVTASTGSFQLDISSAVDTDLLWLRIRADGADGNQHLIDGIQVAAIPEPTTIGLLAIGLLAVARRRC